MTSTRTSVAASAKLSSDKTPLGAQATFQGAPLEELTRCPIVGGCMVTPTIFHNLFTWWLVSIIVSSTYRRVNDIYPT